MDNATESPAVVTTYLEMTSSAELRPKRSEDPLFRVREVTERDWRLNRAMYLSVGQPWAWNDKRRWSDERWQAYIGTDALRTVLGEYDGDIAGYFELHRERDEVEIAYFGLLPQFIGRGLGGALLTSALETAWESNAARVWVHTCSHDHPAALQNYGARGLRIYKTSRRPA
ncbi:MAG: GNAT family N-acetyltransferase [Verrucomicrobiota bacterium]|nr:GNAT family N-acetyltransferase [Verrucomicrobiota bacterium]